MRVRRWLVPLLIVVAAEAVVAVTEADEPQFAPRPKTSAASPNTAIDATNDSVSQGNASELHGTYQFLLEVGGITPAEPSQERKRSAGSSYRRDPRPTGNAIDSTD